MGTLFANTPHLYIVIAISLLNGFLLCCCGYKFLQIIQLTGYKLKGFFLWAKQTKGNYLIRLGMLSLISFACMFTVNSILDGFNLSMYFGYISLIFYIYLTLYFSIKILDNPEKKKTPLKYTHRMNRLLAVLFILSAGTTFGAFVASFSLGKVASSLIGWTPLALLILVPLAFYLTYPFELLINLSYMIKTRKKIKKIERNKKLIKIGITGSYAKTSTKNILTTILSEKYKVCASPASFNTPMGLTKTVLNYLKDDDEVLIMEMGARRVNDITTLTNIIKPDIAILTSIGNQHLETFKTVDRIKQTKFELIKALPQNGLAIFNGENEGLKDLIKKTKVEKLITGFNSKNFAYAKNINISENGTTFTLCFNKKEYEAKTKLLGSHNVENILLASACALKLKLAIEQILSGIEKLVAPPHRLELVKSPNGIIVIDDSYNSNTKGAKMALEVLKLFKGKKFVLTPGVVELGNMQKSANETFGKEIGEIADGCFVVNIANRTALLEGLKNSKIDQKNVYVCEDLSQAKEMFAKILKPNDVLLIENDLPDNFK